MAALLPLALASAPAAAQSHAVVQPLPPAATGDLTDALARLARNGSDFNALIDAGNASLELDDIDAAVGFFGRADELRPGDARVKAGLATAALRSDRPLDAITQFDQAVSAGVDPVSVASDRGLAYDLVGDNASAQAQYRLALSRRADDDTIRRLALSLAISGDKDGFEKTLLPLLQKRDFGAYRVRAMGLAILGRKDEAKSIAEAVMPRDLAAQMLPYLDYMPRLTRAQQAAAANLGKFPRAAQIGRDDPRFAQYSPPASQPKVASAAGSVDSRLAPAGQPLGPRSKTEQPASKAAQPTKLTPAEARRLAREQDRGIRRSRPSLEGATMKRAAPPPPPPPPASTPQASGSVELPPVSGNPKPGFDLATVANQPASQLDSVRQAQAQTPTPTPTPAPVTITPAPRNATPVSNASAVQPFTGSTPPPPPSPPLALPQESRPIVQPLPPPPPPSVADAFAELTLPEAPSQAATGAVDITAIKIKRELPPPPPPPPAPPPPPPPPPEPSRIWVQVATGKDLKALAFDWRRFGKKAPKVLAKRDAFTVEWGQSRRLVTGPFASNKEADAAIADLKALGIDSFRFTSEKGEKVSPLK
ncbi:tetratricopeptide repeat protein [Tsuneonella suprasediminis]|uniref:Tetratricopeptide repeat protein n=2 Tax=Tsuneonella suprasediminis TaxID=2306996 RepID=A0A419R4P5_9SPHN|nr:tetratricopeptide repeat protein [Tsuneonella suprasediminis]